MTSLADIKAAAQRIEGFARKTPLLSSPFLDEIAGRQIFVKPECLQITGSFKYRGARNTISQLSEAELKAGVIAFSSGNHAQGVAFAAQQLGAPATIVMPSDAPKLKIENTRAMGADVVLYDRGSEDRDEIGARLSQERGLTLVKPFDEPQVIAGQGTVGLEIAEQAAALGITKAEVAVPTGGGGLASGVALALEGAAPDMRLRIVEPEDFDDVTRSLQSGRIEQNERLSGSLCDAIITPSPGEIPFPILKRLSGPGIIVTEEAALKAMALAFLRLKIVIEPGGAVALAAALFHGDQMEGETAICVASGGNVDPEVFQTALKTLDR